MAQSKETQAELKELWRELLHEVQTIRSNFERLLGKFEGAHKTILVLIGLASFASAVMGFFFRGAIGR